MPLTKDHKGVKNIHKWIQKQYKGGRTTSISDDEMLDLIREHLSSWAEESGFDL